MGNVNKTPDVSLIMSVYNGEDYLSEALDSVLHQTFTNWELIVINDCSTDKTAAILERYATLDSRIHVYTNEVNLRLPSSLNKALSLAQGRYIARMDADDICLPDRLQKQYDFMESHPDVALSSCRFMTLKNGVIASGGCGGKNDAESIKALLLVTNPILHPGIIAKGEVIQELGYDKRFTCTEDMELWTRFVLAGHKVEILSDYLMIYRLHDKQITETTLDKQRGEVLAVQRQYAATLLEAMSEQRESFYIEGIYFRNHTDIGQFIDFYKWTMAANRRTKAFRSDSLRYALFEILAEYKRRGLPRPDLIRAMLCFGVRFLITELPARKKRAKADGLRCIAAAQGIGLKKTGGTDAFPIFSK